MTQQESLEIIRKAFSHVDVKDIVIGFDPEIGEMKATIYVPEEQYGLAIGDNNGEIARHAAIDSGMSIEVEYADEE